MGRSTVGLVIAGVTLAAGALVFLGPRLLDGVLPPAAVSAIEGMGVDIVPGGQTPRDGETAADFLVDSPRGLLAEGPVAALAGNRPAFISAAISGYSTRVSGDIPAEITTIRPILGCRPTPPMEGTIVGHATAGESGLFMALSTYSDADLAAGVQQFVNDTRNGREAVAAPVGSVAYQAYDVAVTEIRAPVYLVLENASGPRIWNLHLAPGARIERVVLLGGAEAGVANLDPVVPVEVILQDGLAACGIAPAYEPTPAQRQAGAAATGGGGTGGIGDSPADRAAAYDTWFRDTFGVLASAGRAGFAAGTLSVIGPLPGPDEPKAVYASLAGAKIRTTQDQYFEIAGQVAAGEDFAARVRALATQFAFGDLATLRQGVEF